jgi:hypothetical protein
MPEIKRYHGPHAPGRRNLSGYSPATQCCTANKLDLTTIDFGTAAPYSLSIRLNGERGSAPKVSQGHLRHLQQESFSAMTTFDNRKDAAEKKFAHDAELQFKASARRNKLLGLWAAGLLGKSGADAEAYAKSVVMSDFEEAGDDDVFRKVHADLTAGGVATSDHVIRRTMDELMAKAITEIQAGT